MKYLDRQSRIYIDYKGLNQLLTVASPYLPILVTCSPMYLDHIISQGWTYRQNITIAVSTYAITRKYWVLLGKWFISRESSLIGFQRC
jgi:hypothetical protein